jgi:hypothetical protein
MWWQFAAMMLLLLAAGVSLYPAGISKGERIAALASPALSVAGPFPGKSSAGKANLPAATTEVSSLHVRLESETAETKLLEEEKSHLKQELLGDQNDRGELAQKAE